MREPPFEKIPVPHRPSVYARQGLLAGVYTGERYAKERASAGARTCRFKRQRLGTKEPSLPACVDRVDHELSVFCL
jgi:hypothetical protein